MPDESSDFFVSYTAHDSEWAEWVAWELERAGYTVVLQAWDFRPGNNFVLEMDRAAKNSARIIALLSPEFIASAFTGPEWATAFAKDPTGRNRHLVPVRITPVDLKGLLDQIVYIDLVGCDQGESVNRLISGVSIGRARPTTPPPFPPNRREAPFPNSKSTITNFNEPLKANFIGRDQEMAELVGRSGVTVVHGLGGIGKSTLAAQFAAHRIGSWDVVWWIAGTENEVVLAELIDLASAVGVQNTKELDISQILRHLRQALSETGRWLLVFDNLPAPDALPNIQPGSSGHILITSQNPNWRAIAHTIELRPLKRNDAIDVLVHRSGQQPSSSIDEVADLLDGLPLALEQAAAYMEATGISAELYSERYRAAERELLEYGRPLGYPHTVMSTWRLAVSRVRESNPAAIALLQLLSHLSGSGVTRNMIIRCRAVVEPTIPVGTDGRNLDLSVAELRKFSLIGFEGDKLITHQLVQVFTRLTMSQVERNLWARRAIAATICIMPSEGAMINEPSSAVNALAHAIAATGHGIDLQIERQRCSKLLTSIGFYQYLTFDYTRAVDTLQKAHEIQKGIRGLSPKVELRTVSVLAGAQRQAGGIAEAETSYRRSLELNSQIFGARSAELAKALGRYGTFLVQAGRVANGLALHTKAESIWDELGDRSLAGRAYASASRAASMRRNGDPAAAKHLLTEAVAELSSIGQTFTISYAKTLGTLARCEVELGNSETAAKLFTEGLNIKRTLVEKDDPGVAATLQGLASALSAIGKHDEAIARIGEAETILKRTYEDDDWHWAEFHETRAKIEQRQGEHALAVASYERALRLLKGRFGSKHPRVLELTDRLELLRT